MPVGEKLVFTALPEAFFTYFKVALIAGVAFASPVILYQTWVHFLFKEKVGHEDLAREEDAALRKKLDIRSGSMRPARRPGSRRSWCSGFWCLRWN